LVDNKEIGVNHKNYYELLGVAPHVGSGQIQAAYRFARSLYSGEATPTYGLLDASERAQMLTLVEEAYAALSSPNARRDYDIHLSTTGAVDTVARPSPPANRPSEQRRSALPAPNPVSAVEPIAKPLKVPEVVNGAALKVLRQARNLSIEQIAALSKVGSRFLRALEEDRHDALPARVFARGFLIEYARALRVSEAELVERYLKHWPGVA
jgi:curved DNA-binding protein CbpA